MARVVWPLAAHSSIAPLAMPTGKKKTPQEVKEAAERERARSRHQSAEVYATRKVTREGKLDTLAASVHLSFYSMRYGTMSANSSLVCNARVMHCLTPCMSHACVCNNLSSLDHMCPSVLLCAPRLFFCLLRAHSSSSSSSRSSPPPSCSNSSSEGINAEGGVSTATPKESRRSRPS
jgi:hypothetical protein